MPRSRDRILHVLKTKGPQTAAQLADRLAITPMAVRQQLGGLEADGLVVYAEERKGVGRPARRWSLTESAAELFPDSHGELAVGMLEAMRKAFGDKGLEKLVAERTRAQIAAYKERVPPEGSLQKKVAELAAIRREEGYMAEWRREKAGGLTLIENHCPICAAAEVCQGLCSGELELFRTVLGPGVAVERVEHLLEGARRCVYRIRPQR